jgi:hypothetical protein
MVGGHLEILIKIKQRISQLPSNYKHMQPGHLARYARKMPLM